MEVEALEGRLALSGGAVASYAHGAETFSHKTPKTIPIALTYDFSYSDANVMITGASGNLGKIQFTGQGSAALAGSQFEGSSSVLSNAAGSITLDFGRANIKRGRKNDTLNVTVTAESGTGAYNKVGGSTGDVTVTMPNRSTAPQTVKGHFNSFDSKAAADLGY